jgi:nicotinamidase-related amidase
MVLNMRKTALVSLSLAIAFAAATSPITLRLRSRVELFKGSGDWRATTVDYALEPKKTAIILCDIWDKHWCHGATERVGKLAPKVEAVVKRLRAAGVLVIHAPSETMDFYKDSPERKAMLEIPKASLPEALALDSPKLPIDDSDGGCDTSQDKFYKAWTRENPAITIEPGDLISDRGEEVYSALKLRGIDTLLLAGVHVNMCILNRSFAIKQMSKWGVRTILIRDLTDSMYNPADAPRVSHDQGTELVIEHIEKYWAPTITSPELVAALAQRH